jgi:hypothetical protein
MGISKWYNRLKTTLQRLGKTQAAQDIVKVRLLGLEIEVCRVLPGNLPHELTVVIPRVEYRLGQQDREILLNSITIAHSPRFVDGAQRPTVKQ